MIYQRIRDLREDRDLSQAALGAAVGVSQRTYAYYESGQRMLPPEILCALARFHNVSTDYLLELTDEKKPYPKKR
ncbi:MAG: helix-turn-helix transcriptional regulator [Ruminococcaceae bacterium]|nr:helix-turn-helix transcriptional regulator [Oscillospiraceae bacterium]